MHVLFVFNFFIFFSLWNEKLILFSLKFSSSASPESGLGTSHTSLPGSGQGSANDQNEEYFEVEPIQPLGSCKALYPFEGLFLRFKKNIFFLFFVFCSIE